MPSINALSGARLQALHQEALQAKEKKTNTEMKGYHKK
jgi:hypothetical protein